MAKHTLNSSDKDLDFALIGINFIGNQYEALSLINDALNLDFRLNEYIPFSFKSRIFSFSLFGFSDESLGIEYFLIPNSSNFEEKTVEVADASNLFGGMDIDEKTQLIRELPKTDYFVILRGDDLHRHQFRVIEGLRCIQEFRQVQAIDPAGLASRKNLIF